MASVNYKCKTVKITTIMKCRVFVKGFNDAQAGNPFDYAYLDTIPTKDSWGYERGRMLGLHFKGKLKSGRDITIGAYVAYMQLKYDGVVI